VSVSYISMAAENHFGSIPMLIDANLYGPNYRDERPLTGAHKIAIDKE